MKQIYVRHYKQECIGLGPQLCLLVSNAREGPFEFLYDPIEGFEYTWGFDYVIQVEESPVSRPYQDASSLVRRLARIIKRTSRSGVAFELTLTAGEDRIVERGDGVFEFYRERTFTMPLDAERDAMRPVLERQGRIAFVFEHPEDPQQPLILRSWRVLEG